MELVRYCACGCGIVIAANDRRGRPRTFENGHNRASHRMSGSSEYLAYVNAKSRCEDANDVQWKDYGGRGIAFKFASFGQFLAHIGKKSNAGLTLDRINNNGNYELGNVRWSTRIEQSANRRPLGPRNLKKSNAYHRSHYAKNRKRILAYRRGWEAKRKNRNAAGSLLPKK